MAFENLPVPAVETAVITALDDRPQLTAAQLKAAFDQVGVDLYAALCEVVAGVNGHIDALETTDAAGSLGCAPVCVTDDAAANLYAKLVWLKSYMDGLVIAVGAGDMLKSVYDTDGDGVVDNAEKLGGSTPDAFAQAAHTHGNVTSDGKIGSTADLPVFTGSGGAVGTKSVSDARTALGVDSAVAFVDDADSTTKTLAVLADRTVYRLGTLTALTVTAYPAGHYNTLVCFTAGTGITVSLPTTVWNGNIVPTFTAGKYYEVSVRDGNACFGEF